MNNQRDNTDSPDEAGKIEIASDINLDPYVRKNAMDQLDPEKNLDFFIDLSLHDKSFLVRTFAIKIISGFQKGQEILAQLAQDDPDYLIREQAVQQLISKKWEELLYKIATNDSEQEVRSEAVRRIVNQDLLLNFLGNDQPVPIRVAAIRNVKSASVIARMIRDDPSPYVQGVALMFLKDQDLLKDIAQDHPNFSIRESAVKKLNPVSGEGTLKEIAEKDGSPWVRKAAVLHILDRDFLINRYRTDPEYIVRKAALCRIHNKKRLEDLPAEEFDLQLKLDILRKEDGDRFLLDIIKLLGDTGIDEIVRAVLERKDEGKFLKDLIQYWADDAELAEIFRQVIDEETTRTAVEKIKGSNTLEKLATERALGSKRYWVILRITSQDLLNKLAVSEKDPKIRKAVVGRLDKKGDQKLFEQIAASDQDPLIRSIALKKFRDKKKMFDIGMKDESPLVREGILNRLRDEKLLEEFIKTEKDPQLKSRAEYKLRLLRAIDRK